MADRQTSISDAKYQSCSSAPALIRVEEDAGHGIGSTHEQQMAQLADEWTFLLANLGQTRE